MDGFDDESAEVFKTLSEEAPEMLVAIVAERVLTPDGDLDKERFTRATEAMADAGVNLFEVLDENPEAVRENFGTTLTFSDAEIARLNRVIRRMND